MNNVQLSVLCLVITLGIYFANKRLYRRFRKLPLMPLVLTPALLVFNAGVRSYLLAKLYW